MHSVSRLTERDAMRDTHERGVRGILVSQNVPSLARDAMRQFSTSISNASIVSDVSHQSTPMVKTGSSTAQGAQRAVASLVTARRASEHFPRRFSPFLVVRDSVRISSEATVLLTAPLHHEPKLCFKQAVSHWFQLVLKPCVRGQQIQNHR